MSLMLIKRGIGALVGTALVVAILLVVFPAVAEAQGTAKGGAAAVAERPVVVVEPGDSLWSISAQRLGRDASAQQIAKGTERIYALNRDQIGANPNLIFAGQRLSLPRAMGGGVSAATPEAEATTTTMGNSQASRRPVEVGKQGIANRLPKAPEGDDAAPAVPAVRQAASEEDSPTTSSPLAPLLGSVRWVVSSASSAVGETFAEVRAAAVEAPRTTLGWAILVLTVVVGALMAWKLPMRRTTRRDAERWAHYGNYGYYGREHHTTSSYSGERPPHESPAGGAPVAIEPTPNTRTEANDSSAEETPNGGLQAARRRRRRALQQRHALQQRRRALRRVGGRR